MGQMAHTLGFVKKDHMDLMAVFSDYGLIVPVVTLQNIVPNM